MKRFRVRQTYLLFILILSVFLITGCGGGGGVTETGHWLPPPGTAPTVTAVSPVNNATGIAINTKIAASFSEVMDSATITTTTFTLTGATAVSGTVTYSGVNAVFTPASNLAANTVYTATITTGARNLAGNALASNFVWSFKTGATADTTAPTVTLTVPANAATGVAINTKITATFSEAMEPLTITGTTFTVVNTTLGGTAVAGNVTYALAGRTATFTPTTPANLPANTLFTATITTGAKDLAGNALASAYVWTFTTGTAADTTAPTVTLVNPANASTGVCINKTIAATFSEEMDPLTITNLTFTVAGVTGTVTYNATTKIATFTPTANLAAGTLYTATITTGVRDLAGNALASAYVWTFTTGTTTCTTPVALGAAAPFGNLGGTAGTTNQGTFTVIDGDIGTTATVTSAVTGFHDSADIYTETGSNIGRVNGKIYTCTVSTTGPTSAAVNAASCTIATNALSDAQTAYNNMTPAKLPGGANPGGNLGGLTLAPGVYTAPAGSFLITGSDLTLDAQGDEEAVWVFQMASTLTVGAAGAPRSIILAGGAQAENVFWQVGSSATINGAGGGTMVGTIIASAGVSFSTAGNATVVTLNGRAIGLTASVTMTNTVINVPAP